MHMNIEHDTVRYIVLMMSWIYDDAEVVLTFGLTRAISISRIRDI